MRRGSKVSSYNLSAHYSAHAVNNVWVSVKSSVNVLSPETSQRRLMPVSEDTILSIGGIVRSLTRDSHIYIIIFDVAWH